MRLIEFKIQGTAEHVRSASLLTDVKTSPKYSFELILLLLLLLITIIIIYYYYYYYY